MSTFDRTALGRKNRALFYGVDRTLYVEGGRDDRRPAESFDGQFWRRMFSTFRPDLRLKVLPRGSKTNLIALAEKIITDEAEDVIVAMDRDYDDLLDKMMKDKRIVYTFGYSFENDIFSSDALSSLFYSLCPVCDETIGIEREIAEIIGEFCRDGWWGHFADVCGKLVGRKVIDRDHTPKYLTSTAYGSRPKLSKNAINIDVRKANAEKPRERLRNIPLRPNHLPALSVGHLYATFCFKLLSHLHSRHSNTTKLTKDGVTSTAILNISTVIIANDKNVLSIYYRTMLAQC